MPLRIEEGFFRSRSSQLSAFLSLQCGLLEGQPDHSQPPVVAGSKSELLRCSAATAAVLRAALVNTPGIVRNPDFSLAIFPDETLVAARGDDAPESPRSPSLSVEVCFVALAR